MARHHYGAKRATSRSSNNCKLCTFLIRPVITTLTYSQNVLSLRQLHQYLHVLHLARHLRPELFLLRLLFLLIRPCHLARDQSPMTKCLCTTTRLTLAPRLRRSLWPSGVAHLQCPCHVIHQYLPRRHSRRGHPTLEARIARHTQHHLLTGDPARSPQSLVACLSSRRDHRHHHHLRFLLLQAGKAPTCKEHQPRIMTSAAKVNTKATTILILHLVSSTRTR